MIPLPALREILAEKAQQLGELLTRVRHGEPGIEGQIKELRESTKLLKEQIKKASP